MQEVKQFIEEMRATSSSNEKVEILKEQSDFIKQVLEYTYNPYKQYHVTSKTCKKNIHLHSHCNHTLFELLDILTNREATGHDAIKMINRFASKNVDWDVIYDIIDKDLKIRCGAKVINKAFPGLIPEFNVALAQEYKGKCDWNDIWYASRKLDGVRCLAVVDMEGKCTLYSRMGKELTTLNKVKETIESTNIINTVFDGEICLMDEEGNEDFQGVMKQLRRKDHQIENPVFVVFDMISKTDFDNNKGDERLSERLAKLRGWYNNSSVSMEIVRYLDQFTITDDDHFDTWGRMSKDNNWEGFMLRKDVGYEGKRSKNLIKVKKFHDAEYKVVGADFEDHEVVRDGKSETIKMLSQVYIRHKDNTVKVGSGFTQEQRIAFRNDPNLIMGKMITVQYFEETKNDKGGISLRFPTVKHIYNGKRDM
jgi:DNA ligase-1